MRTVAFITALGAVFLCLTTQTLAEQLACGWRQAIVEHLDRKYGETIAGWGLTSSGAVIERFVSEDGGWTLLVTLPNGWSCLVAAGTDWTEQETQPSKRKGNKES